MSDLMGLKKLIQQGAPANGDEAREIIKVALENAVGAAEEWKLRLSSALTEILVGRQLHAETYKARAEALAVLSEIEHGRSRVQTKLPRDVAHR
jgi:type III secretion system FlhB-like substrate exporter